MKTICGPHPPIAQARGHKSLAFSIKQHCKKHPQNKTDGTFQLQIVKIGT